MQFRKPPAEQPEPEPEDEPDHNWVAAGFWMLAKFLRSDAAHSAALDARLDEYLARRGPRPDEETNDPALDHH